MYTRPQLFLIFITTVMMLLAVGMFVMAQAWTEEEPEHVVTAYVLRPDMASMFGNRECPEGYHQNMWKSACESDTSMHYQIVDIYYINQDQTFQYCQDRHAAGCFAGDKWNIYLVRGLEHLTPSWGGCTVLWHELAHAMGYVHDVQKEKWPNDKCKPPRKLQ